MIGTGSIKFKNLKIFSFRTFWFWARPRVVCLLQITIIVICTTVVSLMSIMTASDVFSHRKSRRRAEVMRFAGARSQSFGRAANADLNGTNNCCGAGFLMCTDGCSAMCASCCDGYDIIKRICRMVNRRNGRN